MTGGRRSTTRRHLLPGIVRGAPRRNALVLLVYVLAVIAATQGIWRLL